MSSSTRSPSPKPTDRALSRAQARRVALAAQGFADARPAGPIDRRHVRTVLGRVGLIQIDSVNVLVRSQELALFARLGPHRRDVLAAMAADGELFEYWGHEASLLPSGTHPHLRWRMDAARRGETWQSTARVARERPDFIEELYAQVRRRGPASASELGGAGERKGPWWGWGDTKRALEFLFWCGRITARRRTNTFERIYDIPERVLPPAVMSAPTPPDDVAQHELVRTAVRALGVATERDIADYFRMKRADVQPALSTMVDSGEAIPVHVEGWRDRAYLDAAARQPRTIKARSLLSPFDSLVWERARTERLFDFRYRLEIYTPAPKRVYGYYVLPFLLADRIVARVDLKADRASSTLRVIGAFAEPEIEISETTAALVEELEAMREWLELESLEIGERGDLTPHLRRARQTRQARRAPSPTATRRAPVPPSGARRTAR